MNFEPLKNNHINTCQLLYIPRYIDEWKRMKHLLWITYIVHVPRMTKICAYCLTRALKVDIMNYWDPIIYTQVHVIPSYKNQQWVLSMRINALYWARGTQSQTLCQKLCKNSKFMIQMFKIIVWNIYTLKFYITIVRSLKHNSLINSAICIE